MARFFGCLILVFFVKICYSHLGNLGFRHIVVVHDIGFGEGFRITNGIESIWSQIKRLTGFYSGMHGDPGYIQSVVTFLTKISYLNKM